MVTLDVATKHGKGKPNKRWALAFATIYYARALFSLLDQKKKENNRKLLPPTRNSFVLIDVEAPEAAFSSIDKTALAAIVKEKNLDRLLRQLGGIEGVASALETNIRNGISTLLFGSKVVAADEDAPMLVTLVGMNTTWGAMMTETDINEETPLQAWLNKFASSIAKPGLAVLSFLIVVALLVRYFIGNTEKEKGNQEFDGSSTKAGAIVNSMVRIIAVAVTIGLVAIPEGLSWAVAVILAYSGNRMIADKVIVRKRSACETMGSATTICILTLNQVKVAKFWLGQDLIGEDPNSSSIATNVLNLIQQGVALNTTGSVYRATSGSNTQFCGIPSEKALLS